MFNKTQITIKIIYFIIALYLTIFFIGPNNIWFNSIDWLIGSGDSTNAQLSWQYFKDDIWRFPLGKNPNYGLEVSNSIIFTDNIPIFAIFFKILSPIIYDKFQYFSLWIFTCFFLQLYFSYKLIISATNNKYFSIISSLFFLLCPFLFFRLTLHFALGAHWLILYAFYISFFIQENKKEKHWYFLLLLSLLIHLYFTAMIFVIYFSFSIENYFLKKKIKFELKNLFYKLIFSFLIMFVTGYFESNLINAMSTGYGQFKIDLFGFFDPKIDGHKNWSLFIKDLPGNNEIDSFVYVGFGNIILFIIGIMIFLKNMIKKKKFRK